MIRSLIATLLVVKLLAKYEQQKIGTANEYLFGVKIICQQHLNHTNLCSTCKYYIDPRLIYAFWTKHAIKPENWTHTYEEHANWNYEGSKQIFEIYKKVNFNPEHTFFE